MIVELVFEIIRGGSKKCFGKVSRNQKDSSSPAKTPTDHYAQFSAQPFERGFGTTIGNALRRVLLSSIEGAAITAVKIEGVLHEFSSIPGVVEDATDIILNLKQIPLKLHGDERKDDLPEGHAARRLHLRQHRTRCRHRDSRQEHLHRHRQRRRLAADRNARPEWPRLRFRRPQLRRRSGHRLHPGGFGSFAGPQGELLRRSGASRPGDRLRQADDRDLDQRFDHSAGCSRSGCEADQGSHADLHSVRRESRSPSKSRRRFVTMPSSSI